jgi:thioredoxin-related protein
MLSRTVIHAPRVLAPGAYCCLIFACFLLWAAPAGAQQHQGIRWLNYAQVLQQAPQANKPMFIFFRAPWCYICKKMQRLVFPDPKLSGYLNQRYLAVEVDVTKEKRVAEVYKVNYLPTCIILSKQGKPVLTLKGYLTSQQLIQALGFVADGHHEKMSFQAYQDNH